MNWSFINKSVAVLLSITVILLLLLNAYYVWNWGDDYLIKHFYKTRSPMAYLWNDYFTFDGRSLNPGYIISRTFLDFNVPYLATIFATILLILTSVFIVMINNSSKVYQWKNEFVSTVIVLTLLWLALFNSLNEILYWQTGILYMVELFLIAWLYWLLVIDTKHSWLIILLGFLTGMSSPNAVIACIFVFSIEFFYLKKQGMSLKHYRLAIVALFIGLLIVILAPGSGTRWHMQGGADSKALGSIYELYFRLQQMLMAFIELNTIIVWFMIAGGLMVIIGFSAKVSNKRLLEYLYDFRWMIAALISIAFYFPKMTYYIQTSRLNCHFVFFSGLFYFTQLKKLKIAKPEIYQFQYSTLCIPILFLGFVFMFTQVLGSRHCVAKLKIREQLYRHQQGKDMILKANDIIGPPRTKFFTDVHEDSSHVFNQSIAEFYGLKSIRREKYR